MINKIGYSKREDKKRKPTPAKRLKTKKERTTQQKHTKQKRWSRPHADNNTRQAEQKKNFQSISSTMMTKTKKRQNKCISSFNSGQAYLNIQQSKRCMPFQLASLGRPVILFLPSRGKFTGTTLNRFPSKHSSNWRWQSSSRANQKMK